MPLSLGFIFIQDPCIQDPGNSIEPKYPVLVCNQVSVDENTGIWHGVKVCA